MAWGDTPASDKLKDIVLGGFWPDISAEKFKLRYRIPAEIPGDTITDHLRLAALTVCRQLAGWQAQQTVDTLAEVPQASVDFEGSLVPFFERAVFCEAKAALLRETVTVDRRPAAENAAKAGDATEDKYREFAAEAIAAIVGSSRITVTII
ncbi:MAG: head completion/stabilization protein [Victivallaceae bacterium]